MSVARFALIVAAVTYLTWPVISIILVANIMALTDSPQAAAYFGEWALPLAFLPIVVFVALLSLAVSWGARRLCRI